MLTHYDIILTLLDGLPHLLLYTAVTVDDTTVTPTLLSAYANILRISVLHHK